MHDARAVCHRQRAEDPARDPHRARSVERAVCAEGCRERPLLEGLHDDVGRGLQGVR
jgi:hypothetical protein